MLAIVEGDLVTVRRLLAEDPDLATARVGDNGRSMLHYATDWPGHYPYVGETIKALIAAGADPNVRFPHPENPAVAETPLHWAASSNDVEAAEALLDAGADVDALGGIFDGCTPFPEAIIFENYDAARLLLERGATSYLPGACALGQADEIDRFFHRDGSLDLGANRLPHWHELPPAQDVLDRALQFACRSGHLEIAKRIHERGADPKAISPADTTAAEMAADNGHTAIVQWLASLG